MINLLKERNISLNKLGKAVGVSGQHIGMIIRNERHYSISLLLKIANHLKVSTDFLLDWENMSRSGKLSDLEIAAMENIKRLSKEHNWHFMSFIQIDEEALCVIRHDRKYYGPIRFCDAKKLVEGMEDYNIIEMYNPLELKNHEIQRD